MGAKVPEPTWHTVRMDGSIEVRDYDAMLVANVVVSGMRYAALKNGFRILAGYIFGGNAAQIKFAMTAPVTQEAVIITDQNLGIAGPELQQLLEPEREWAIRFVMPPGYTLTSLPSPTDARIKLLAIPARRMAVIRFAGFNSNSNLICHLEALLGWLKAHDIIPTGGLIYAFYDPPWTLPFFKRNEVMVSISV